MAASALDSIIQWAQQELYPWQADAVRRLLLREDSLPADEEEQIYLMLKERKGIFEPKNPAPKPIPLQRGEISGAPSEKVKLTLKAISDLKNVNAIPDGSGLKFGNEGLTVIYGENGSGKSGYARVLKKACKARDTNERLIPNVYTTKNFAPAEASFKISKNRSEDDIPWQDGKEETGILSNICVFDSKCARVIVDENNETEYLPYGAGVFPLLVNLMKNLRTKIEKDKPRPEKLQYDDIPCATPSGKIISGLAASTSMDMIESLSKWEKTEDAKLLQLKKQITDAQINDPAKVAKRLRNTKDRINSIITAISTIDAALSGDKEKSIADAITKSIAAEKALALASKETLSAEPLLGAGEKAWQILYAAAKDYSTKHAYPGKEFPVMDKGSLCVLCMQPLEEPAIKRMQRFKEFMEKSTKENAERAELKLKELSEDLSKIAFPAQESYKDLMDEFREKYPEAIKSVEEYFPWMRRRAEQIQNAMKERTITAIQSPKENPKSKIEQISSQLEKEAQEVEKTANPEELKKKIEEKDDLEARKLFSERKKTIKDYIENLQLAQKYDACYAETEFIGITVAGKTIIKRALTPQLKRQLEEELKELGAEHLPLNLKASGGEGQTLHKLELDTKLPLIKIDLSDILSEGEMCVVGIAGFLAELHLAEHECTIVLDDPVCSLDHIYMRHIAKRLVKEAEKRQVIIFTHDIGFMLQLKHFAAESGRICFTPQTVCRQDTVGKCLVGLPWHSMEVKERLAFLRGQLEEAKKDYPVNMMEYNKKAASIYGFLRETWEAFIEETLLNGAIIRHGLEVHTQNLKSVKIENPDYKTIHFGMLNCSTWMTGHDRAKGLTENRPSPPDVLKEIEVLEKFAKEIRKRNQEVRKEREEFLEPKAAAIG